MKAGPSRGLPDARYESIFEHAAVSLWEEDISKLRARLAELRKNGVLSARAWISEHPDFVQEAVALVDVIDVNQATLRLFEAERKDQVIGPLSRTLPESRRTSFAQTICAMDEGMSDLEAESTAMTLKGRRLSLIVKTHIPSPDAAYPRMLVSVIDITARKEAEEREQQSATILQSILESSPGPIVIKDLHLRTILCNTAHSRALGKEPEELYGKTDVENGWSRDLVEGDAAKGISGWEKDDLAAVSGRTVETAAVPSSVGGQIRYFDAIKLPVRDSRGTVVGIVGIGRDVTERRRIEAELAHERSLFSTLMENMPDFIYFKDRESRFIRVSRSLAIEQGLREPSDALGKTDQDFLPPEVAREKRQDELRIMRTGGPLVDIEEKLSYVSGPEMWQLTSKLPLRDEKGAVIGTFGISHDITRRKQLEARSQQLAALVESSDDAIVGMDLQRGITVWNKGAERIYGYAAKEMVGTQTSTLIPPELEPEARLMRERALRGEQLTHYETTRLRKDGARIQISLTLSAVRDAAGRIVGLASVARDVTEQKALQSQLDRAQRLEGLATMAGGVAHQFNNINTVVLGYIDMMIADPEVAVRPRSYAERARTAVQRSVDITSRLLAMTDPGSPAAPSSMDRLARLAAAAVDRRLKAAGVEAELRLDPTPPVEVDESRMTFVLTSLLDNAVDSLLDRPARKICVRTGSGADEVFAEVEDSGCGIPKEDLRRVFTPFFTAKGEWAPPGSAQGGVRGVGLSLAVSQAIMNGYGGRIEVRSTPGAGSVFRVILPIGR